MGKTLTNIRCWKGRTRKRLATALWLRCSAATAAVVAVAVGARSNYPCALCACTSSNKSNGNGTNGGTSVIARTVDRSQRDCSSRSTSRGDQSKNSVCAPLRGVLREPYTISPIEISNRIKISPANRKGSFGLFIRLFVRSLVVVAVKYIYVEMFVPFSSTRRSKWAGDRYSITAHATTFVVAKAQSIFGSFSRRYLGSTLESVHASACLSVFGRLVNYTIHIMLLFMTNC